MIKKVKIRDLTEEQQKRYCDKKNGHCNGCPFCLKNFEGKDWTCASSLSHIPFSDEFLDQEVEIEVPDILTKEEKNMILGYRAWLLKEKKMVGVLDILLRGGGIIQTECEDSDYDGLSKVVGRDCVLMQFTGLNDTNGKEIYEGDILESDNENFATGVVVYDDGRFAIKKPNGKIIAYDHTIWTAYEVIGNIYENPELLEEKQ